MLTVENLVAGYGTSVVLQGIDLEVRRGCTVALIGPNGAGKTTTMRAVSGMIRPTSGSIRVNGRDIAGIPASRLAGMGIAHVPEGRRVFAPLSVEDNLLLGGYGWLPKLWGFGTRARADLERAYALFPRLRERRRQSAGTLSGGEQQMLAIGRALMGRPKLLLLDEPSMGLAPVLVEQIFRIIRDINAQGTTILLVEQNAQMALQVAGRGYILQTGKIVLADTAAALAQNEQVKIAYLGG